MKDTPLEFEIIDVLQDPEKAEEYKIEALPTLLLDGKLFVGSITSEEIISMLIKKV